MNNILFIATKDVKFLLKDRSTLVWLFIMPGVFFFFIGTLTGGFSSSFGGSGGTTPILLTQAEDSGFLSEQLSIRLIDNQFEVVTLDPEGELSRQLEVPAGFTESVLAGQPVSLTYNPSAGGLTRELEEVRIQRASLTVIGDLLAVMESGQEPSMALLEAFNQLDRPLTLSTSFAGSDVFIPSGFAQAIPGIMVMFTMLILLSSGASWLVTERDQGLLRRLASTPITRGELVAGKWLGRMGLGVIQLAVGMLIGTLVFQMNWGPDWPFLIVVLLAWSGFCASFGLLLGNIAKSEGQVVGLGMLSTMTLAALGGAWWPIEITPSWMQSLQSFLPSGWAMDAMHKLISFQAGPASILMNVLLLLLAALVLGSLGARYFRYQS